MRLDEQRVLAESAANQQRLEFVPPALFEGVDDVLRPVLNAHRNEELLFPN